MEVNTGKIVPCGCSYEKCQKHFVLGTGMPGFDGRLELAEARVVAQAYALQEAVTLLLKGNGVLTKSAVIKYAENVLKESIEGPKE